MGILNQDYVSWLHTSSLLYIYIWIYTLIFRSNYIFTKVHLTKTDETNDVSSIVSISLKLWLLFCGLVHQTWIISRVSPAFLQQFFAIDSFHYFAFLRTDGEGTSPPPCSKLLAHAVRLLSSSYRYTSSVFHARRNVTLRSVQSLFPSVSDGFFL